MAKLSRREFLLIGIAGGATVAVGVVLPIALTAPTETETGTPDPTTPTLPPATDPPAPPPVGVVGFFPRLKVADLADLQVGNPVPFEYPLQGQSNVLVKLGTPAVGGVGTDGDIVAFSNICTHMGCVLTDFRSDHNVLGPCPCHFTTFDLARGGMVGLGQATEGLPQVVLDVEEDSVFAAGVLRLVYGHYDTLQGSQPVAVTP